MSQPIPLIDLKAPHAEIAAEIAAGFARVIEQTAFILGKDVQEFEERFAAFCGVRYCLGVANGTDAVELALRANGIGPGHEVILPANTFIATALAVARAGATPVLVDCDPIYQLLDPVQVAARVTAKTRAIIPVHLFGQLAPMDEIIEIASANNLFVIEDAAQSQGASQHLRAAGSWGIAAGTSFYPGKNLGAYGDAGAVLTDSESVAKRVRALRNYGSEIKYHHPETGFNSRLDTLQAVVLNAKLKRLSHWNDLRRAAAARYSQWLADVPNLQRPQVLPGNEHVWHLYVVRVPRRAHVLERLHAAGIGAGVHYPTPIHLQGAFANLGHRAGDFPVAELAANEILSLPLFPEISIEQQERVVSALSHALSSA